MLCIRLLVGERERANLVVWTAEFSLYIYVTGAGRHHTVMFYVILNTRTNVKFHKGSTKLHVFEARLFGCSWWMQRSNSKLALRHETLAVQVAGARALQTPLVKARKLTLHVFLFCTCMYVHVFCVLLGQRLAFETAQERVQLASNLRKVGFK